MNKKEKITIVSNIILGGFIFAILYHCVAGVFLGFSWPYNTFLFMPTERFNDFFCPFIASRDLNPYASPGTGLHEYAPLSYVFFYFFSLLTPDKYVALFIYLFLFCTFIVYMNFYYFYRINKSLTFIGRLRNFLILSFLTFPFLHTIDRGNIEGLIFVFFVIFFWFYIKKKWILSAIFLSVIIAMKLYPAAFIFLFVAEKKHRYAVISFALSLLFLFWGFSLFQGGAFLNIRLFLLEFNKSLTLYGFEWLLNGPNLWGMLKVVVASTDGVLHLWSQIRTVYLVYSVFVCIIFILICLYISFIEKEFWKKALLLTLCILFFPFITGHYRLMFLFVPLYLFFENDKKSRTDLFYCIAFSALLIPMNYFHVRNQFWVPASLIQATVMLLLFIVVIFQGLYAYRSGVKSDNVKEELPQITQ